MDKAKTLNASNSTVTRIRINARDVEQIGPQTWEITLSVRELTPAEREILEALYPTQLDSAYSLLNREALTAAITPR